MNTKKYVCPQCNSDDVIDILYGYPSEKTLQSWFKKEIELGGCIIRGENPHHKCKKCGNQW